MNRWLKDKRGQNQPKDIWPILKVKLQGHYNYYGVSGNIEGLKQYYHKTKDVSFIGVTEKAKMTDGVGIEFEKYLTRYPLPLPKLTYEIYHTW